MANLSQSEVRTTNQKRDRLGDRRTSILPERRDTRAPELRPSGDMRSASRGDVGGAEALMRTLGMVKDATKDFQAYAGDKFAKDENANASRGLLDQAADRVDPELERKSMAYKDSVARGRTATAWNARAVELDAELRGMVERQDQLTLEERQEEARQHIEQAYRDFAIDPETGQLQSFLATPGAMRYLGEKMSEARGTAEANILKQVEERFNTEALGHYTQNIRDQSNGGPVDIKSAMALLPPTVPLEIVRKATIDTVLEIGENLKASGREVDAVKLYDSILAGGFEVGVGGESTDDTAIAAVRGSPRAIDIPASNVAPRATPEAPSYNRAALKGKIAAPESAGNDNAVNGMGSSASGRYQFVEGTFKQLYKRVYGASSSQARDAWATKRFDVGIQEKLMDALIADNEAILTGARIPITDGNMYVMHVLGSGDGPKFLKAGPSTPVADILSAQIVRQNPTYFGGGKTVGQAYSKIASVVGVSSGVGGEITDPVEDDPTYVSPARALSPVEQYLSGPKDTIVPVMTGGLALTQQERNRVIELRKQYVETAKQEWHKKRSDDQSDAASGMSMRILGQGAPITSQEISDAAEAGDITEPDAVQLMRMLRQDAAQERAEADRITRDAREAEALADEEMVDSVTARIMAPVYTGKRKPEEARRMMLEELSKLPPKVARRALQEMTPTLGALEGAAAQTPAARDTITMMDETDRNAFIAAATKDVRPSARKKAATAASSLMDRAIQRVSRDIERGVPPAEAHQRANVWLSGQIASVKALDGR